MFNRAAGLRAGALLIACCWSAGLYGADTSTVTYPFLGVTHIFRVGSAPDFPRNVRMHIVKIDLTAPFLSFKLPPRGGTRDTLKKRTLDYINLVGAQIGMNMHFFNPVTTPATPGGTSADLNTELIGFGASAGDVISPFELPFQNYAILRDSPGLNIDPNNNASIVTAAPGFSDGSCQSCLANDGLHVQENVTIWNTVTGSAQTITNGVKTIPCYRDATHPDCQLDGSLSPATVIPPYSNTKSWYDLLNARSAIGLSQDNKTLFLFTVDSAGGSAGMMIGEVADLLIRDYGVYNALSTDGGGSVSLAMEDPVTHVRSLGQLAIERRVRARGGQQPGGLRVQHDQCHAHGEHVAGRPGLFGGRIGFHERADSHLVLRKQPHDCDYLAAGGCSRNAVHVHQLVGWRRDFAFGQRSASSDKLHRQFRHAVSTGHGGLAGRCGKVTPASGGYCDRGFDGRPAGHGDPGYVFQSWTGAGRQPVQRLDNDGRPDRAHIGDRQFRCRAHGSLGNHHVQVGPRQREDVHHHAGEPGPGVANSARITALTLTQTSGPACTPVITTRFPSSVGNIAPGASATGSVTIDFTGCAPANRYTVALTYSANGGAVTGSKTLYNQFQ